ncbi:MAG: hypothetical protein ACRENX_11720 [Candidatus Dormibacteria bacterium]
MSDSGIPNEDSSTVAPLPQLTPLGPAGRIGQRRFTLLLAGALVVLILIRLLTTHPLPTPSHSSSTGAVAGYLVGLENSDVSQVRQYLAPAKKSQARAIVEAFKSRRAYVAAPALAYVEQEKSRATVTISLQVCAPFNGSKEYTCEPVAHEPLGLPDELTCIKVAGDWYVATLLKPS